jgi:endonuclease/exonuclease/phosphatase family metal-dependent hydrolase
MNASIMEQLERSFDTVDNATGASFDLDYVSIPKATFIAALALLPIAHPLLPLLGTIDLLSCPPFAIRSYGAELLNSGLLSVGLNKSFGSSTSYRFQNRGDLLKDADYYSAKGVLKTVIGVNVGQIDVYSTHLYNGGDFIADVTEEEKQQVKLAQVTELLEFVNTSSSPSNVSIIMGDFNIDGIDLESEFYQEFISRMNAAGFDDICVQRCLDADRNIIIQPTSNTNNNICEVEGNFCNELTTSISEGATRLDYIFIERQNDSHSFILDYTRPRRVSFPNTEISPDMNFLSDHLGLEIILKPSVS